MYISLGMYYPLKLFLFSLRKELLNTLPFLKNRRTKHNPLPPKPPTYGMETRYRVNKNRKHKTN